MLAAIEMRDEIERKATRLKLFSHADREGWLEGSANEQLSMRSIDRTSRVRLKNGHTALQITKHVPANLWASFAHDAKHFRPFRV